MARTYAKVSMNREQLLAVRQRLYADYHAAMTSGDVKRANEPVCFAFTKVADALQRLDDDHAAGVPESPNAV